MLSLNHKNLKVYQKSIELVSDIYALTQKFPVHEKFGLTSQLRRSAISIPSNIAEGSSRKTEKERKRFYEISRSSLVELDTQIGISISLGYLNKNQITKVEKLANEIFAMLSAMSK
ncbi:MAG TPA: four helix bundle protein [Balneolaceae bacterium]|nr:four helix bundle protein [Balneolaceae bacterium]